QDTPKPTVGIEFLRWECDHVFSELSDYTASILDMATQQHPSVLKSFALDISSPSQSGLASAQNILYRSNLDHLYILCIECDLSFSDPIAQLIGSVQWSNLKSLKLSGDHINAWIRIWMSCHNNPFSPNARADGGPRLLQLHLQGTGSVPQLLSHTSALLVHGLVYLSPSVE
ncbi:hypothetical protein BGZ52_000301, partial [Haplosporangium bisporale]